MNLDGDMRDGLYEQSINQTLVCVHYRNTAMLRSDLGCFPENCSALALNETMETMTYLILDCSARASIHRHSFALRVVFVFCVL